MSVTDRDQEVDAVLDTVLGAPSLGVAVNGSHRQAEKSAAMRDRILSAAADCIAENGLHRTSVSMVVQKAAISQGALQHHFPTKLDLIASTASWLLENSIRWFARHKADLRGGPESFTEALHRSWNEQFQSPGYAAMLEILVAARTDETLRVRVTPALTAWSDAVTRELSETFPSIEDRQKIDRVIRMSRAMMTGFVVHEGLLKTPADKLLDEWACMAAPPPG